jgi:hypothetical protein
MSFDEMRLADQEDTWTNVQIWAKGPDGSRFWEMREQGMRAHLESVYAGMDADTLAAYRTEVAGRTIDKWTVTIDHSPVVALIDAEITARDKADTDALIAEVRDAIAVSGIATAPDFEVVAA